MLTLTEKKLTDSRKRAKVLADNRKSHHPIETLLEGNRFFVGWVISHLGKSTSHAPYFLSLENDPRSTVTFNDHTQAWRK